MLLVKLKPRYYSRLPKTQAAILCVNCINCMTLENPGDLIRAKVACNSTGKSNLVSIIIVFIHVLRFIFG